MPFLNANSDEVPWHTPPGHFGAFSRYLVGPDTHGSRHFDFRISRYPQGGYVETHTHREAEHIYYFLDGAGTAECGDQTRQVGPGDVMFVPAGVPHSLVCAGEQPLWLLVVTSPPGIPT